MDRLFVICMGCWLAALGGTAAAQAYPAKSIRVVVPYAPGGATDLTARLVGQKMNDSFRQTVVIDNRTGAGGVIGADIVARAAPDGYTVLLASPAEIAVLPHLQKMPYNVDKDFAPVSLASTTPLILVLHPSVPVKSVKALIAFVKARPGQMTYASAGTGGVQHLAGELLKITFKLDMVHVPYKGAGPVMPDLIGGHVPMFFSGMPPAMPHVKAGKLRALAVTSTTRSPAAPNVPTMAEAGVPDFVFTNWFAYFVPAGTPAGVISTLNAEINRALKLEDVKTRLATVGLETVGTTPEELAKFVRSESDKFAQLIRQSGAKGTD
ncbi:MAG: LacI family transcriptional regulator [Betaproteobacteria bacterium RIFCSPLOWO2_12_FULL_62_58]|nr:MAG: LacI family transcriptional regulator [Betaproteobacteria bacterium RIFCSPLOWO2_02_FULL_62_79]OGA53326.1 MAG: LacI family transcriptional regulator [Betaproteobacteria bacterium RIFCSPLOWO2_12_FULL_62_58]